MEYDIIDLIEDGRTADVCADCYSSLDEDETRRSVSVGVSVGR